MPAKTKIEIIEETVEYYLTHKRGSSPTGCQYLVVSTGAKCAVGRCQIDPQPDWMGCPSSGITLGEDDNLIDFEASLKPEYRGHCVEFWDHLQEFHDQASYWYSNSMTTGGHRLTDKGNEAFEELLNRWKD